ncbi:MAG: LapA family protein [Calditrichaeota bacterium]|nr:LapA family protein [Calditrichota bacterium]
MWILRWIIGALLIILIIGFALQNTDQQVTVTFIQWQSVNLPLWVVMYVSFAVGILFWLVVSILQILGLKNTNRKSQKEIKKLRQELDRLRNVSVEEAVSPSPEEKIPQPDKKKTQRSS